MVPFRCIPYTIAPVTREEYRTLLASADWDRTRLRVILKSRSRCQRCKQLKAHSDLDIHHNPPVNASTTRQQFFDESRLECLCKPCHSRIPNSPQHEPKKEIKVLGEDGKLTEDWIAMRKRPRKQRKKRSRGHRTGSGIRVN